MLVAITGCAVSRPVEPKESYRAMGQEPGWSLQIGNGRLLYTGDYGETTIDLPAPSPQPIANGRRYAAMGQGHRIIADIIHTLCHDGMSGHAYSDTVRLVADGNALQGCGGQRLPAQDR
jgi:uncharacterized membrane protein